MAAAGYRERAYVDLYYTVKLLGPVVAGLIAGFLLRGRECLHLVHHSGGGRLSRARFLVDRRGDAAQGENPAGASRRA